MQFAFYYGIDYNTFLPEKITKSRELYQHYLYLTSRVASYNKKNGVLSANMVNPNGICTGTIKYLWDAMTFCIDVCSDYAYANTTKI